MELKEGLLDFGTAVKLAKDGVKVCRVGWKGESFVVVMSALNLPPHSSQEPGAKVNDRTATFIGEDTPLNSQPYFAKYYGDGKWQPGWLPSQEDILTDDWCLVQ